MSQPGQVRPPVPGLRTASGVQPPLPAPSAPQAASAALHAGAATSFHADLAAAAACNQAAVTQSPARLELSQVQTAGVACESGAQEQQIRDFKQHLHQQLQLAAAAAAAAAARQYHQQSNSDDRLDSTSSAARRSLVRPWES